jgi:hypothetical protein
LTDKAYFYRKEHEAREENTEEKLCALGVLGGENNVCPSISAYYPIPNL